jgi:hypothetical protein
MNILEIVIMVVLVIIIVGGISIPPDIQTIVGGVPGIIIILFILMQALHKVWFRSAM